MNFPRLLDLLKNAWHGLGAFSQKHQWQILAFSFLVTTASFFVALRPPQDEEFEGKPQETNEFSNERTYEIYFHLMSDGGESNQRTIDTLEGLVGQTVPLKITVWQNGSGRNDWSFFEYCRGLGFEDTSPHRRNQFFGHEFIVPLITDRAYEYREEDQYERSDCRTRVMIFDDELNASWEIDCAACIRLELNGIYQITVDKVMLSRVYRIVRMSD